MFHHSTYKHHLIWKGGCARELVVKSLQYMQTIMYASSSLSQFTLIQPPYNQFVDFRPSILCGFNSRVQACSPLQYFRPT